jgi:hypothetical protein
MKMLAIAVFAILVLIAALHAYWAFGGLWPAGDERKLVATVIGAQGRAHMPPAWLTLTVAALILSGGLFALVSQDIIAMGPRWLVRAALIVLTLVFTARGAAGYLLPGGVGQAEPFATLDRLYYSPLCLALGAAFAILLVFMKSGARR